MKPDNQGCSTCKMGEESYEKFSTKIHGKRVDRWQYDYRHTNGELFSTVKASIEKCREERDKWIETL